MRPSRPNCGKAGWEMEKLFNGIGMSPPPMVARPLLTVMDGMVAEPAGTTTFNDCGGAGVRRFCNYPAVCAPAAI
jgi:hypothetical protein